MTLYLIIKKIAPIFVNQQGESPRFVEYFRKYTLSFQMQILKREADDLEAVEHKQNGTAPIATGESPLTPSDTEVVQRISMNQAVQCKLHFLNMVINNLAGILKESSDEVPRISMDGTLPKKRTGFVMPSVEEEKTDGDEQVCFD